MNKTNKIFSRCLCNDLESFVSGYKLHTNNKTGFGVYEIEFSEKEQYNIRYFLLEELLKPYIDLWGQNEEK